MKESSIKLFIRRFVLATSFPPFLQIYKLVYRLVTLIALQIFRRYDAIKAVYLRRGGAKGEILPLISDIDFALIEKEMSEVEKEELICSYEKLARATTILDQSLEIYDEKTFLENYDTNDYFQYRFTEGKETWKLLFGKDYLSDLPKLPMEKMYGGFLTEIKVWWSLFAWRFFQSRKYNDEFVTRNNVCYKTVSEILKMNIALNHDLFIFDRKQALELSKPHLSQETHGFLRKLELIERNRFYLQDHGILEETKDFMFRYLLFFMPLRAFGAIHHLIGTDHPLSAQDQEMA